MKHYFSARSFELLYCNYEGSARHVLNKFHAHSFWQIEFIIRGAPTLETSGENIELLPDNVVIIPPDVVHRFNYHKQIKESCSVKFHCSLDSKFPLCLVKEDPDTLIVQEALKKLIMSHSNLSTSPIAAHLIYGFLEKYIPGQAHEEAHPLITRVRELIFQRQGQKADLLYLAEKMGYSPSYLSVKFKKETGRQLKKFIDEELADTAKKLLEYSNYSIGEIAEKMGFSDQFAFSHFFKRLCRTSPRDYRINIIKKEGSK
jgi:AraC-like DNA-binding protein